MLLGVKGLLAPHKRNNITKFMDRCRELGVKLRCREFKYLSFGPFGTYDIDRKHKVEKRLNNLLHNGDSIIAHSFGGVLTCDLLDFYEKNGIKKQLKNIFLFNPSVDRDIKIPHCNFEYCFVFFDRKDAMLRWARFLPFNRMGALGKYGYQHKCKKIINVPIRLIDNKDLFSHQKAMREPNLTYYSKFIAMMEKGDKDEKEAAIDAVVNQKEIIWAD